MASCVLDLLRVGVVVGQADALHGDLDRSGRAEAHHLGDDVGGFEGDLASGSSRWSGGADALAEGFAARGIGLQGDLHDGLLRTAGKEMDQVDRIAGAARRRRNRW